MDWRERLPEGLRDNTTELYVNSVERREYSVDCALGFSPVGAPDSVVSTFGGLFGEDLSMYVPPADRLADPVCRFWNGLVAPNELAFANGTDTILVVLAKTLGATGGRILGMAPQFTDAPVHFQLSGCDFMAVELDGPSYRIETGRILKYLDDSISLVYIDRPHNPTGQLMALEDLEKIVVASEKVGALVIVDEAYGDFVDESTSCLNLKNGNIVCLRSFSKGWGMAGIRGGYGVFRSSYARDLYLRVSPPFTVDALAFSAIPMALKEAETFLPSMRKNVARLKDQVVNTITESPGFSVAYTHPSVAIMLVTYADPSANLYEMLMDNGIKAAPGSGFIGIGDNSVRLRVPPESQIAEFKSRWRAMTSSLER